jgi:hypothetical protein
MMMQATAGSLTGVGEVALVYLFMEGLTLYRGWGWTLARKAPASFAVCCFPPHLLSFFLR